MKTTMFVLEQGRGESSPRLTRRVVTSSEEVLRPGGVNEQDYDVYIAADDKLFLAGSKYVDETGIWLPAGSVPKKNARSVANADPSTPVDPDFERAQAVALLKVVFSPNWATIDLTIGEFAYFLGARSKIDRGRDIEGAQRQRYKKGDPRKIYKCLQARAKWPPLAEGAARRRKNPPGEAWFDPKEIKSFLFVTDDEEIAGAAIRAGCWGYEPDVTATASSATKEEALRAEHAPLDQAVAAEEAPPRAGDDTGRSPDRAPSQAEVADLFATVVDKVQQASARGLIARILQRSKRDSMGRSTNVPSVVATLEGDAAQWLELMEFYGNRRRLGFPDDWIVCTEGRLDPQRDRAWIDLHIYSATAPAGLLASWMPMADVDAVFPVAFEPGEYNIVAKEIIERSLQRFGTGRWNSREGRLVEPLEPEKFHVRHCHVAFRIGEVDPTMIVLAPEPHVRTMLLVGIQRTHSLPELCLQKVPFELDYRRGTPEHARASQMLRDLSKGKVE